MVGEQQCLIDMTIMIVLYGWANFLCSDSSIIFSWKKSSREKKKERKTEDGGKTERADGLIEWIQIPIYSEEVCRGQPAIGE